MLAQNIKIKFLNVADCFRFNGTERCRYQKEVLIFAVNVARLMRELLRHLLRLGISRLCSVIGKLINLCGGN
jgi:hypothetical protein